MVKSQMATEEKPVSGDRMLVSSFLFISVLKLVCVYVYRFCCYISQVFVPPHPLIKHWVSVLRNEQTPSPIFSKCVNTTVMILSVISALLIRVQIGCC